MNEKKNYKKRHSILKLPLLSLYIEMRDLLYLIALKEGKYDVGLQKSIKEIKRTDKNFSTEQKFCTT